MSDFTSGFWSWYIAIPTVLGIAACFVLIRWLSGGTHRPGQAVQTMGHVWDEDLAEYNNPLPRWWLNMFYITLFFGIGYLLLYPGLGSFKGLLGWTSQGQYEHQMAQADAKYGPLFDRYKDTPIPKLLDEPEALRIGARLFATYCTACHGADARGVRGFPNLRDQDWLWGGTPDKIVETITGGRQAAMPAWGPILGEDGVFSVAEYVRSLSGRDVDAQVAGRGREIFMKNCVACHGPEGKGNPLLGAPNLTDNVWLYGSSQARLVETITKGRNGRMPAWGEFLGPSKVHLLAAYVYSLSVDEFHGQGEPPAP